MSFRAVGLVANAIAVAREPIGLQSLRYADGLASLLDLRPCLIIFWRNVVFGSIGGDWCPTNLT